MTWPIKRRSLLRVSNARPGITAHRGVLTTMSYVLVDSIVWKDKPLDLTMPVHLDIMGKYNELFLGNRPCPNLAMAIGCSGNAEV